jgi:uncharacterized protein
MNIEDQNQPPRNDENEPGTKLFSTLSPITTAIFALFGIFFLYQIGGALLTLLIFGFDFEKANITAVRLLTMGGQLMLILLPTLIFARAVYHENTSYILRMRFPNIKEIGAFVIGLILLTPMLQSLINIQNYLLQSLASASPFVKNITSILDRIDKLIDQTYGNLLKSNSFFESSFIVFMVAVVPAICEETLFRGLVQKSFEQKLTPGWSIFITSFFFGMYHFNPYGLVALIALGIYFGYAAYKSDSIFVSMALHFTNNFLTVTAFFVLGNDELINSTPTSNIHLLPQVLAFILFALLFTSYIIFVRKNYFRLVST